MRKAQEKHFVWRLSEHVSKIDRVALATYTSSIPNISVLTTSYLVHFVCDLTDIVANSFALV